MVKHHWTKLYLEKKDFLDCVVIMSNNQQITTINIVSSQIATIFYENWLLFDINQQILMI